MPERSGRRDAGAIALLRVSAPARFLDQSAGGLETPETNDRFGAAVASHGIAIAAGAPGEDVRGRRDAGLVLDYSVFLRPRRSYRQGARSVPGRTEAGDRFGSALASGFSLFCQEDSPLAVGVPGEDSGRAHDAGAVTLIQGGDVTNCHSRELIQGRGLPGRAHSREHTGATLGIAPDIPGLDEDTYDTLLVGVPSGNPRPSGGLLALPQAAERAAGRARLRQRVRAAERGVTNVMPKS